MQLSSTMRQLHGIFDQDGYAFFGIVVLFFRLIIIIFKMNTPKSDFENLKFSPFDFQYILLNNSSGPDDNFFNTNHFPDTNYFTIEETKSKLFAVIQVFFNTSSEYKKFKEKP